MMTLVLHDIVQRSKHESDCIDDNCDHRHQPLPEFVYEYMLQLYNTKPAADKEAFMFIDAIEEHKGNSKTVGCQSYVNISHR